MGRFTSKRWLSELRARVFVTIAPTFAPAPRAVLGDDLWTGDSSSLGIAEFEYSKKEWVEAGGLTVKFNLPPGPEVLWCQPHALWYSSYGADQGSVARHALNVG